MPENQPLTSSERGGGDPVEEEIIHFSDKNPLFFLDSNGYFDCFETKTSNSLLRKETVVFFFKFFFFSTTLHRQQIHKVVQRHFRRQKKLLLSMSLSLVKFLP